MLYGLLTGRLEYALSQIDEGKITEIRLRRGRPLVVVEGEKRIHPITDTEKVLGFATDFSIYAVNDQLTKGYLVKNGVRIGVSGFGVVEQGKIITIKDINALYGEYQAGSDLETRAPLTNFCQDDAEPGVGRG